MLEHTDQSESVDIRLLLQILHDGSISVPGKHQAEVCDGRGYPVERDNVVVLDLLHQRHLLPKPLFHTSGR